MLFLGSIAIIMNDSIIYTDNTTLPVLCSCDFLAASEPFTHADRVVDFNDLIYVTNGTIYVTEDNIDYTLKKGDMIILKSGVRHYGKKDIPKGTQWYFIHFYLNVNNTLPCFSPDNLPIPHYETVHSKAMLPKTLSGLENTDLEREITDFADYFSSNDPYKKWNVNFRLAELLSHIAFYSSEIKKDSISEKICAFLYDNLNVPFSSDDIEQKFFLSYKHLSTLFKKETGITMQQYHFNLKMNEACKLLRSTLLSIGEISLQLGYTDPLYFSRCFNKFTGLSPTDYRRLPKIM